MTATESTNGTTLDLDAMAATIDAHLVAYGDADAARRAGAIAAVWATDGELIDPPIDGKGHDGITALGDVVQAHFAGNTFRRTTAVDAHHGVARYGWAMVAADGSVTMTGLDVAEFDAAGKLARIVGFFGELTPIA